MFCQTENIAILISGPMVYKTGPGDKHHMDIVPVQLWHHLVFPRYTRFSTGDKCHMVIVPMIERGSEDVLSLFQLQYNDLVYISKGAV